MRCLFILLSFFILGCAKAQFTLSVSGGVNTNTISQKRTDGYIYSNYHSGGGWQFALQAGYNIKHWFVFTGAGISENSFRHNVLYAPPTGSSNDTITFHPVYLTAPVGVGYEFTLKPKVFLRLFTGFYVSEAIGGSLYQRYSTCGEVACREQPPITQQIKYGNSFSDLSKTNAGLQFGAAIRAWKRFEFGCTYLMGLKNINPSDITSENIKLRTFAVDAKFYIIK